MTLQHYWEGGRVPGIPGFTFANGRVLKLDSRDCNGAYEFRRSTLPEEESEFDDIPVETAMAGKVLYHRGWIFYGQCEMGNQGFLVFQDEHHIAQWSFFQEFANPFVSASLIDLDVLLATTEIQYEWLIPLRNPAGLTCRSRNPWGY